MARAILLRDAATMSAAALVVSSAACRDAGIEGSFAIKSAHASATLAAVVVGGARRLAFGLLHIVLEHGVVDDHAEGAVGALAVRDASGAVLWLGRRWQLGAGDLRRAVLARALIASRDAGLVVEGAVGDAAGARVDVVRDRARATGDRGGDNGDDEKAAEVREREHSRSMSRLRVNAQVEASRKILRARGQSSRWRPAALGAAAAQGSIAIALFRSPLTRAVGKTAAALLRVAGVIVAAFEAMRGRAEVFASEAASNTFGAIVIRLTTRGDASVEGLTFIDATDTGFRRGAILVDDAWCKAVGLLLAFAAEDDPTANDTEGASGALVVGVATRAAPRFHGYPKVGTGNGDDAVGGRTVVACRQARGVVERAAALAAMKVAFAFAFALAFALARRLRVTGAEGEQEGDEDAHHV